MLALDRRASVRLQSQTNWRRAAVSFPWRRISGRSMAARPVQHLRQQMSLAARTRGRTRRTLGCYGRPPCPRRRCCGRFVSDLIVSGGRRRNEGAIATVMERRVLTMMGGRIAMMALSVGRQLNSDAANADQRADRVESWRTYRALLMPTFGHSDTLRARGVRPRQAPADSDASGEARANRSSIRFSYRPGWDGAASNVGSDGCASRSFGTGVRPG